MMRTLTALLLIAASGATAAPVPKELKKSDLDRIAGVWILTGSCNHGGEVTPADGSRWKFEADGKATIIDKAGKEMGGIKFAIGSAAEPKTFDWIAPWGEWYGVCEFGDATFTFYVYSKGRGTGRNPELKTGPGVEMQTFRRAAPGK